jgi:hypothetical protein
MTALKSARRSTKLYEHAEAKIPRPWCRLTPLNN